MLTRQTDIHSDSDLDVEAIVVALRTVLQELHFRTQGRSVTLEYRVLMEIRL